MKNPYDILGVPRTASQAEIKKTYRARAKKLHPDRHPGDASAEARFKELSAAYALLSDPKQRARFDNGEIDAEGAERMRANFHRAHAGAEPGDFAGFDGGSDAAGGFHFSFEDLVSPLFRNRRGGQAASGKGADRTARVEVGFIEAVTGAKKRLLVDGKELEVAVPAGIESGKTIRLKGRGSPSPLGGPNGDLLLTVSVADHPHFTRKGNDIHLDLPVTLAEAVSGARVDVPTPHGKVSLTIPPGSNTGTLLRLKGKGVAPKDGTPGNQVVRLLVSLPDKPDPELSEFVAHWKGGRDHDPRRKLRG